MKHARGRRAKRTATTKQRRHTRLLVVALAAAVGVFTVIDSAMTTVTAAPQDQAEKKPGQKKYKATRPIAIDKETGAARMPTEPEVEALVATLSTLTNRPADGLAETAGSAGAITVDLAGGFAGVLLARANADGTYETRCVFTFEEGAEFLGLVEAQ